MFPHSYILWSHNTLNSGIPRQKPLIVKTYLTRTYSCSYQALAVFGVICIGFNLYSLVPPPSHRLPVANVNKMTDKSA